MIELKSFKQRRELSREDREHYTLDMGERHQCPLCGQVHYRRKDNDEGFNKDASEGNRKLSEVEGA